MIVKLLIDDVFIVLLLILRQARNFDNNRKCRNLVCKALKMKNSCVKVVLFDRSFIKQIFFCLPSVSVLLNVDCSVNPGTF